MSGEEASSSMAVHATSESTTTALPLRSALRCAIAYIHAHPGEALGCRDIAGLAGLSVSQCARQFRRITGLAPHRYLLQVRVALVKTLLCESERDLVLIAADAGFADQSHMNRVFRRLTGTTPGAFRLAEFARRRSEVDRFSRCNVGVSGWAARHDESVAGERAKAPVFEGE